MSGFFTRALGAAKREFNRLISTPWEWVTAIVLPFVWCVLLCGLFHQGLMRDLPMGVVDLDKTPQSQSLQGYVDALPSVSFLVYFFGSLLTGTLKDACGAFWMPLLGWSIVLSFAVIITVLIIRKNNKLKNEALAKTRS